MLLKALSADTLVHVTGQGVNLDTTLHADRYECLLGEIVFTDRLHSFIAVKRLHQERGQCIFIISLKIRKYLLDHNLPYV